jgi:Ran GTPase-activating protein (RanGAP) involved in mRNA processing and transport
MGNSNSDASFLDLRGKIKRKVDLVKTLLKESKIDSLSLAWNELNDEDMTSIADIIKENKIRELDLSWNRIGPQGAFILAEALEKNTSLIQLILINNPITSKGAMFFAQGMKKNISLRFLALRSDANPIDERIISLLKVLASTSRAQSCNTLILMIHNKILPLDLMRELFKFIF